MDFRPILIICLCATSVFCSDTVSRDNIEPNDDANRLSLSILESLSRNMAKIEKNLLDLNNKFGELNHRFDELKEKQEIQESKIIKLMETADINVNRVNDSRSESNKRLETEQNNTETWTKILLRKDGSLNFNRNWSEYQKGFGNPSNGEFFIGLDKIHEMTSRSQQELIVILKDWKNETRSASYDNFLVGGEGEKYALKELGHYSGDAGDDLYYHKGMNFSTYDQDNDESMHNCAKQFKGGWWFESCYHSYLNGPYRKERNKRNFGINWYHWKNSTAYSLRYAEMKIRPKAV